MRNLVVRSKWDDQGFYYNWFMDGWPGRQILDKKFFTGSPVFHSRFQKIKNGIVAKKSVGYL